METISKKSIRSNFREKLRLDTRILSGQEEKKMLECEICGKILSNNKTLAQHSAIHEGKKPFKCDICDYSCSRKDSMKKHIATVHEGKTVVV